MYTIRTDNVQLGTSLSLFASRGKLLNADEQYLWLHSRNNLIGWTYCFNRSCPLWQSFARLISCQGQPTKQVRIANNVHMKCYIDRKSMLVTSFNLTYPTIIDLGFEIKDVVLCNHMRKVFDKHWKELE